MRVAMGVVMRLHMVIDRRTGEARVQGRDGTTYTTDEVERARGRAISDRDAAAIVDNVRVPEGANIHALLDDCPECRAARARGEEPIVMSPSRWDRFRQPRWRTFKRKVRR
jgi:hypothetical protein